MRGSASLLVKISIVALVAVLLGILKGVLFAAIASLLMLLAGAARPLVDPGAHSAQRANGSAGKSRSRISASASRRRISQITWSCELPPLARPPGFATDVR